MGGFLLFGYDTYYPGGGEADYIGRYETLAQAKAAARGPEGKNQEYFDVYDIDGDNWIDVD